MILVKYTMSVSILVLFIICVAIITCKSNKANDILMKVATAVVVIGFLTILVGQYVCA